MSHLFSPIRIGALTYKNRIAVSPMCQYSGKDGFATDWHLVHLGSRAVGGAALVIQEATAVTAEGRISPEDLGIWKEEHIEGLKRIVTFIHAQGSRAGIQLAHAGRKASVSSPWSGNRLLMPEEGGWQPVAPSPIPFTEGSRPPTEMSRADIQSVISAFAEAAKRAVTAGYDVIEIHAAHGYLIHEFLSPIANQRSDEYGGTFDNRTRLLMEIIRAIQSLLTEGQNLFVRISATDYIAGGWDLEQSVRLSALMEDQGVSLVDVSSGAILPDVSIQLFKNYQVPFAEAIKRKCSRIKVGTVGIITEAVQAEDILAQDMADMIFMGRELLRNPYFPLGAANLLDNTNIFPPQYTRAFRKIGVQP